MNTKIDKSEGISALMDNELSAAQRDVILANLHDVNDKCTWDLYHQIGDSLRSDELAVQFSADFSQRFSERLDAEPTILAPRAVASANAAPSKTPNRYWLAVGMAAMATLAFVMAPQSNLEHSPTPALQLSQAPVVEPGIRMASNSSAPESIKAGAQPQALPGNQIEMLRDPRIDSYLMAHQRFSPAISNGAQYVTRANAVASASEK